MRLNDNIISIGGVGGSGTRVVAEIFKKSGYFIGDDLNESNDTLLFTLLFKRQNVLTLSDDEFDDTVRIFVKIMSSRNILSEDELVTLAMLASKDRRLHNRAWLQERLRYVDEREEHLFWGWKEPNTHIIIERLFYKMNNLKFIYVYRNGLDMAYSDNQNQLKLWGSIFFNDYDVNINPANSLKYWCIIHKRMLKFKEKFQERVFILNFDEMCLNSENILTQLSNFIGYKGDILEFSRLIKTPSSIGRYKAFSLDDFYKEDLEYVQSL